MKFIRKLFKANYNSFKDYSKNSEAIKSQTNIWSNSFLDFYPFQSEMDQLTPPKIYKERPNHEEGVILTKIYNELMYCALQVENQNWGTQFYLHNYSEKMKVLKNEEDYLLHFSEKTKELLKKEGYLYDFPFKIRLLFNDQNDDEKMKLSQVEFVNFDTNGAIKTILYYSFDKDCEEETFMIDTYHYDEDKKVSFIERNGFYEEENNVLDTRTFRFEYVNEKVKIYSKQMKLNGEIKEQQIFPGNNASRQQAVLA